MALDARTPLSSSLSHPQTYHSRPGRNRAASGFLLKFFCVSPSSVCPPSTLLAIVQCTTHAVIRVCIASVYYSGLHCVRTTSSTFLLVNAGHVLVSTPCGPLWGIKEERGGPKNSNALHRAVTGVGIFTIAIVLDTLHLHERTQRRSGTAQTSIHPCACMCVEEVTGRLGHNENAVILVGRERERERAV